MHDDEERDIVRRRLSGGVEEECQKQDHFESSRELHSKADRIKRLASEDEQL